MQEIQKGYSLILKYKGWYIGSISAIKENIKVVIETIGLSMYIRYDGGNGFIQYVCDEIEIKKIKE